MHLLDIRLTFRVFLVFLEGDVTKMKDSSYQHEDGHLVGIADPHLGHSLITHSEVTRVVQNRVVQASQLQVLWRGRERGQTSSITVYAHTKVPKEVHIM